VVAAVTQAAMVLRLEARAVAAEEAAEALVGAPVALAVAVAPAFTWAAMADAGAGVVPPHQAIHLALVAMLLSRWNLKGFEHATH